MTELFQTTARRARRAPVSRMPALMLALAATATLLSLFVPRAPAASWMGWVAPLDPLDTDPVLACLSVVGCAAIALGLIRGKRVSWWLAVATFAAALVAQATALAHPLETVVLGGALAVLVADRHRYRVETRASWRPWIAALILVAALAVGAETALVIAATGTWPTPLGALSSATAALGNMFGVGDDLAGSILGLTGRGGLFAALLIAARLPMALSAVGVLARIPEPTPDPTVRSRLRAIARRHGRGALLPFQLGDDKLLFCPPGMDACVVYGLAGRTAVVLGDPIAAGPAKAEVLTAFLERSRELDRVVAVYQATASLRSALLGAGFYLFRVGQEAIIDLQAFDLSGSWRANLRHTISRAKRGDVQVHWFPSGLTGPDADRLSAGLTAVDRVWRVHAGPRLGFTIGKFEFDDIRSLPVSLATDADGRPVAFATFRPTGPDGGWVLDLMRRTPGGTPGAVEWCIAEAALAFKAMGSPTLSLGLVPLDGLESRSGPLGERLLALAARLARPRYDVKGLAYFKEKFDPRWEPRYAAVPSLWDVPGMSLALLRLHLRRDVGRRSAGDLVSEGSERPVATGHDPVAAEADPR